MTQLQGRTQRGSPLVLWAACFGMLLACRSPADPSGIDVLGDAGTPNKQKPEVDPSSDKPVGPIAERTPLGGMGNRDGDPAPRDLVGGAGSGGGGGSAGVPGKVPVDSVARRNAGSAL
jgi:hypothetical protein